MSDGEVAARVLITILGSMSILVGFPAAISALIKWRRNRAEVAAWDEEAGTRLRLRQESGAKRDALMADHSIPDGQPKLDALHRISEEETAELLSRGWDPGSYDQFETRGVMVERPVKMFQAPIEVWFGLFAIACGVAGSIWDVWLP